MKKTIIFLFAALCAVILGSCGPHMYSTQSSGKDNVSYVIVLSEANFSNKNVSVIVDGKEFRYGTVYKMKAKRKAHPVIVEPGKHNIKVAIDGTVISDENVFLGLQETKMIVL